MARRISAGVAADRGAGLVELGALGGEPVRLAPDVPDVGVPRGRRQRPLLAAAGDQDRQPVLQRRRLVGRVGQLEVPALEGRSARRGAATATTATVSSKRSDRSAGRQQVDAVGEVLVDLPAGAEPGDRAAAADVVDGRDHVRDHGRVPVGAAHHQRTQPGPAGDRREPGEEGAALEERLVARGVVVVVLHEVVAHVDRVDTELLGGQRELADLRPWPAVVEDHADVHGRIMAPGRPGRAMSLRRIRS